MKYNLEQIVSKATLNQTSMTDEIIKRQIAVEVIKKLPLEYLEKIFEFKIIDPDSDENKKILEAGLLSEEYLIKKINRLKEMDCVEYSAVIDFDNIKSE